MIRLLSLFVLVALFAGEGGTAICHKVNGRGNTGNGYNLIVVNNVRPHRNHAGDLIPAPNGFCFVPFPTTTRPPNTTPPPASSQPPTTPLPDRPTTTVRPPTGTTQPPNPPPVQPPLPTLGGTLPPSR